MTALAGVPLDAAACYQALQARDCLQLAYRPPLQWDAILEFLAARVIAGVEQVSAGCYRRIVQVSARGQLIHGWIEVSHRPERRALMLRVDPALRDALGSLLGAVRRLFDLDARPDDITRVLGPLAQHEPGLRMPGAIDGFELAVRAILGQQVSVKAAHTLAGRVARRFGTPIDTGIDGLELAFAQPAVIAEAQTTDLTALGIVSQRAAAIIGLARAICDGVVRLTPDADVDAQIAALRAIPGIGDWTAQYIAMRALGWPDAFPAADLVLMRALGVRTPAQARAAAAHWSPWRSYAVMHLWRNQARAAMAANTVRASG
jgi:AraC family transcriptional regulator of adaptative response / DNA-3-methyladenine glycosylase II